jgi:poly(A) polymerase
MNDYPPAALVQRGFPAYLWGFSAIDAYLGRSAIGENLILTGAGPADLARIFEELRYPGIDIADAALDAGNSAFYFRYANFENFSGPADRFLFCNSDPFRTSEGRFPTFPILEFYRDLRTGWFLDPRGNYSLLRRIIKGQQPEFPPDAIRDGCERIRALMDWALILAKYFPLDEMRSFGPEQPPSTQTTFPMIGSPADVFQAGHKPGAEEQRLLLAGLLAAPNPALGLEFLMHSGFIREYWHELAVLDDVDHSKEFHPEGNAWKHTMETFRYRKASGGAFDLRLSMGLLLHDIGKPLAEAAGSRRFDGHAELGERQAGRFLHRLGFSPALISDVCYLVRNHMFPAALPRLPLIRTEEKMANPLFPVLLELYRCDESSSFKGLNGYYESSAAYQSFLRYRRNPYRTADGKKIDRRDVLSNY